MIFSFEFSHFSTSERLSQGLNDFSDNTELLNNYADVVKEYVDDKAIFVIDGSDVTKPCSNSLEDLGLVRDGSIGERFLYKAVFGNGLVIVAQYLTGG